MAARKAKKKKNDWVKKAIKHPGAFRQWCQQRGHSKVTTSCIESGLRQSDPTIKRRAALAKALKKMREKRKKKK